MSPSWRRRGKMAVFFSIVDGAESSLSIDEVLRKRYQGKLEYREVDLVDRLPPPHRMNQLALTAAPSISPTGSSASEENPLHTRPISIGMPLCSTRPCEPVTGTPIATKRIQTRCRASEQPVASTFSFIPVPGVPFVPPNFSLVKGSSGLGQVSVSLCGVSGDSSTRSSVFVPSWDLHNDSQLSVRANALEFSHHCNIRIPSHAFPPATVGDMEAMNFTNAISLIQHAAFVAEVESVQKTYVGAGGRDVGVGATSVGRLLSGTPKSAVGHEVVPVFEVDAGGGNEGGEDDGDHSVGSNVGDGNECEVVVVGSEVAGDGNDVVEDAPASCATPPRA
ncbi:unnamed protein product [Lactuca saligna]|uniref:Uncharacterized protein n=1 Tax=Lactuca saligna TaxID=75948 RepID=A0AA35YDQ1_LACSI|nr:unnamed protein product [Lactuca saligna]